MSDKKKPRVLTLKGSQWARGGRNGDSGLLNERGCSCCIGVDALSRGIPPSALRDAGEPMQVPLRPIPSDFAADWLRNYDRNNNAAASECMHLNDLSAGLFVEPGVLLRDDAHRVDLLRPYFRNLPSGPVILRFRPDL